ncbi:unnamed protein product, partial [Pocillopora meandrina]
RPPKHYQPLLKREKELFSIVQKTLLKPIANSLIQKGSRLTHIYDPQEETSIPYKLAKWLNDKLKPLSTIDQTISDILFADDLHEMKIADQDILVSYNISSFFTNIPVDETIKILAEKAFRDNCFKRKYALNITKTDLNDLLEVATKKQRTTNSKCVYVPY